MFNDYHLNSFLDTAIERHKIYLKKQAGAPKPWTEDPIFQNFFFCNLFRKYDKCTKWIIENIIPYDRWDIIILYRFISTMSTFLEIEQKCDLDDFQSIKNLLADIKHRGDKIFSSCFIRNPRIKGGWTETYKVPFYLINEIKEEGNFERIANFHSLELMTIYLSRFSGTKGFMAYEYACDFEYSKWFYPSDKYSWANMGPGAQRGMSLVLEGHDRRKFKQEEWLTLAVKLKDLLSKNFEKIFLEMKEEKVSMREVEHWLCEYQKYVKYKNMWETGQMVKHRKYHGKEE